MSEYGRNESRHENNTCWVPDETVIDSFVKANNAKAEYYKVAADYYKILIAKERGENKKAKDVRDRAEALSAAIF